MSVRVTFVTLCICLRGASCQSIVNGRSECLLCVCACL